MPQAPRATPGKGTGLEIVVPGAGRSSGSMGEGKNAKLQLSTELHTSLGDGIYQIRLPMTGNVLKYINAYLIEDADGYTLVDCGWGLPDVLEALQKACGEIGLPLDKIRTVVATHFHMDHYGLAGTLAQIAGSRVLMHRADWMILDARFRDVYGETVRRDAWLRRNGLDTADMPVDERVQYLMERYSLVAPERELEDGEMLQVGKHRFQVVHTPGHTPGHICLYDAERSMILSGDHVLPGITPHVGFWDHFSGLDPIGEYLASLRKLTALGAKTALPAHREPIADLPGRCDEILAHHAERSAEVLASLGASWKTGVEIADKLTWRRGLATYESLPQTLKVSALAETLAHLEHLRVQGRVERESQPESIRYKLAAA